MAQSLLRVNIFGVVGEKRAAVFMTEPGKVLLLLSLVHQGSGKRRGVLLGLGSHFGGNSSRSRSI
jgi:hypothetical protein